MGTINDQFLILEWKQMHLLYSTSIQKTLTLNYNYTIFCYWKLHHNLTNKYLNWFSAIISCSCSTVSIIIRWHWYIFISICDNTLVISLCVTDTHVQFWILATFSRSNGMSVVSERTRLACCDRKAWDCLTLYAVLWHLGTQLQYEVMFSARPALTGETIVIII